MEPTNTVPSPPKSQSCPIEPGPSSTSETTGARNPPVATQKLKTKSTRSSEHSYFSLPACPKESELAPLNARPFSQAASVRALICSRVACLHAAGALRRQQRALFAPPRSNARNERGAQAYIVAGATNVFTSYGAHATPWYQIAATNCGTSRPWLPCWDAFIVRLHRFYRIVKCASHAICPACVHASLLYSVSGVPRPTQAALISGAVSGYDMGLDTCLKHTYSRNDSSVRWDDRIAACKIQKDIDASFVEVSNKRPTCSVCRRPVSRIQLLLVPKDNRHIEFDARLAKFARLVWNYSSPKTVCLNEFLRVHRITGDRRPTFINYGSHAGAARMILQAQDRATKQARSEHKGPGEPPWQQLEMCVLDQPAAYRQLSTDRWFQDYACALLPTLEDPAQPKTSVLKYRWVQDRRANFGAVLAGFHQYTNAMNIIGTTSDVFTRLDLMADVMVNTDDFFLVASTADFVTARQALVATNAAMGYSLVGKPAFGFPDLGQQGVRTLWCGAVYGTATATDHAFREIPAEYMMHVIRMIDSWRGATSANIKDADALVGTLIWLCQIAPALRPLCEPVIEIRRALAQLEIAIQAVQVRALKRQTRKAKHAERSNASIVLPAATPEMLHSIMDFLTRYVKHPISRLVHEEEIDVKTMLLVYSDSQPGSGTMRPAAGVFIAGFYARITFTEAQIERATRKPNLGQGPENNCLELWVALIGLIIAWKLFPNEFGAIPRVSVVDSSVAAGQLKKNRARHPEANRLLRITNLVAAVSGFQFAIAAQPVVRVLSADMEFADPLSRFDDAKFFSQVAAMDGLDHIYELKIPPSLIDLTSIDDIIDANIDIPPCICPRLYRNFWRSQQAFTAAPSYQGRSTNTTPQLRPSGQLASNIGSCGYHSATAATDTSGYPA